MAKKRRNYVCSSCGAVELRWMGKCPSCGKLKLKRQVGAGGGILFKGSGFYETDYRSDSYRKGAEAEKKAESPGGSDAKPKKDSSE